ncbi:MULTISPECIES: glucose 1-dehydrogenase [unclassified Isoptericola]|uniref:glucose 1-dehydrogenase n=1 Tax=unclassified Isoptericola TaxID=2623355 RepID=UPI002713F970|nr:MULTISPECIES: glucose 1-dehydrogenase [unclassified Isoptericola]MDO8145014.1 glucose 1-dehydrogenase [Isoptericola sp. 178]MDO8148648.1 glucose 1-dehydrogenase [Isoptericola sp. b515]
MRALTIVPGQADSLAVTDVADPVAGPDELLVDGVAVGICGTDHEIARGEHGAPPPGQERLVLGHESLGRVREAPDDSGFSPGDLVVGVVRRPDPVPCGACAHGEWDMCRNGLFTEHGIKEVDGFAAERWTVAADRAVRLDPDLADVGVLLEPTTVVTKAWEQVDRIGARSWFDPQRVLVTGAGPIGLLAALVGARRGLDVHVLDRATDGPKPGLVRDLGATYHHDDPTAVADRVEPDVIVECTGAPAVVMDTVTSTRPYGITVLTGISSAGHQVPVDAGAANRSVVLENDVVVGSVNANLRHYRAAAEALAGADRDWLARLVTRRLPLDRAVEALTPQDDDVKVVVDLA